MLPGTVVPHDPAPLSAPPPACPPPPHAPALTSAASRASLSSPPGLLPVPSATRSTAVRPPAAVCGRCKATPVRPPCRKLNRGGSEGQGCGARTGRRPALRLESSSSTHFVINADAVETTSTY